MWERFRRQKSDGERNLLIEHYLPMVQQIAERIRMKIGRLVQVEDLIAAGVFGLIDAIESFDENRRVRFTTFSAIRIRGAILDELRAMDWVPRLMRSRAKRIDAAWRALHSELGRPPSEQEIALRLGLSDHEYLKQSREARLALIRPLKSRREDNAAEDDPAGADIMPADASEIDPVNEAQRHALCEMLTRSLSRAERLLVVLYYYEGLSMREIGKALDLSESRVSQLHTSICRRLRDVADNSRADTIAELAAA
jgi:RNA polymerase sigma factor for flagellar operon FliA